MKKKLDVVIVGHDPDYCLLLGLNVEFLRNSPPVHFLETLGSHWGTSPSTYGGWVGSDYLESVPCGLCLEDYRFRSSHRTIEQLLHALKALKAEVPALDINEIGWYYQGRSSYITPYLSGCGSHIDPQKKGVLPICHRPPKSFVCEYEGQSLTFNEVGCTIDKQDYVVCPTTGRKLNPNTLLPIEDHVDFTTKGIL